jgi:NB-ARC domain
VSAVSGTAGAGKTALAVYWAHRVADRFPDGQLYVNLRGFDPTGSVVRPADAVRWFLDTLGVPTEQVPADPEAQTALYRSRLAGKRILVLLDNARDSAQARPLLPGTPTGFALVTSRSQLTGLIATDGAQPVNVDVLTVDEARELLARRLGAERVAAEPEAVEQIVSYSARLPLALAVLAARAATHPHLPLHSLAGELRECRERLDSLSTDDPYTDVRAVFSWSYHALTPGAARLFRMLGPHPARTSAHPRRRAWPLSRFRRCGRCWPSWRGRTWSSSTPPATTCTTTSCARTPPTLPAPTTPTSSAANQVIGCWTITCTRRTPRTGCWTRRVT